MLGSMILQIMVIYAHHGTPSDAQSYAQKCVQNVTTRSSMQALMYGFIFLLSRPFFIALLPVLIVEGWWFAKTLSTKHPSIHVMLSKIITPLFKMMLSLPNESITLDQMANTIQPFIAQIELMVGLFLIFELFTPYRNIIILFVFWNWMKMRYQLNSYTQDAFRKFDRTISPYALKIPIISNVYVVVKNFMIKQSAMPQPGNQGGGLMGGVSNMMRSCSVM